MCGIVVFPPGLFGPEYTLATGNKLTNYVYKKSWSELVNLNLYCYLRKGNKF